MDLADKIIAIILDKENMEKVTLTPLDLREVSGSLKAVENPDGTLTIWRIK